MKTKLVLLALLLACFLGMLTGCSKNSHPSLKVAATSVPHAEILEFIKPKLQEQGIDLSIVIVEDYNIPNRALQDGEVDANFFQHLPFLNAQMKDFGYDLESLTPVHLEPMALYSHTLHSLNELKPRSTIAIPSDPSNQARALALIQQQGLIHLKKADAKTSVLDITDNPHQLKFIEIDSPLLTRSLEDVDLAAITTNFALQAGLLPKRDALAVEDAHSLFVNVLVIRKGDEQRDDIQALKSALTSPEVKTFIDDHYQGAVIPAF